MSCCQGEDEELRHVPRRWMRYEQMDESQIGQFHVVCCISLGLYYYYYYYYYYFLTLSTQFPKVVKKIEKVLN